MQAERVSVGKEVAADPYLRASGRCGQLAPPTRTDRRDSGGTGNDTPRHDPTSWLACWAMPLDENERSVVGELVVLVLDDRSYESTDDLFWFELV